MQEDEDEDEGSLPPSSPAKSTLSPSQPLPSFQSLLQTIREDADEEDNEIREIEERAMQGSKSLPVLKDTQTPPNHNNYQQSEPHVSSNFYKNSVSKSNENLPSLSRMSISDIIE